LQDDGSCGFSFNDILFVLMRLADDMLSLGNNPADLEQRVDSLNEYCSK